MSPQGKPRLQLTSRESLNGWTLILVTVGVSIAVVDIIEQWEPFSDIHWSWVSFVPFGLTMIGGGVLIFGSVSPLQDARSRWPGSVQRHWNRLLAWHTGLVWLLGLLAVVVTQAFRAEMIAEETLVRVWVVLLASGVVCSLAMRRSVRRRLRASVSEAPAGDG